MSALPNLQIYVDVYTEAHQPPRLQRRILVPPPLRDGGGRVEDAGIPQSAFVQAILSRERAEESRNTAENDA